MTKLLYFRIKKDYGKNEWIFKNRKEKLITLREAFKEYAGINDLPYDSGAILVLSEIHLKGVHDENSMFGRVDYSKTTYSIEVKILAYVNNDKDAEYWNRRFSEEIA